MQVIRPIRREDLDALIEIAELSGPGFTSLPCNPDLLQQRIEESIHTLSQPADVDHRGYYLFVLEDSDQQRVIGTTAISGAVGVEDPWYHYRIGTVVHASRKMQVHNRFKTLYLCNDYTAHSEIGSLFLHPDYRRNHLYRHMGALLSKSRFLFMAQHPERFAERVIAEMRGYTNELGTSPFWEGLGRNFFSMEFSEADYHTGMGNKSFIAELMPKHSIYIHLLPESAQRVIGEVHANTRPARKMLEDEGFHFEGYVDIFDAGPTLVCRLKDIRSVCYSELCTLRQLTPELPPKSPSSQTYLIANTRLEQFRCLVVELDDVLPGHLQLPQPVAEALQLVPGDSVRLVALPLTRKRRYGGDSNE